MPLHEPSPYEVLGIPLTAGVREINLSVGKALKAGRYSRQQIQDAAALLRNPDRRLEVDLQQPLPPEPVDQAADLLAPALAEPLLVIDRPGLPPAAALLALHRAEAAADLGCEPARIAKTMAFVVAGHAVLVVIAGDAKVDNPRFKAAFHTKAAMVRPDQLVEQVGNDKTKRHATGNINVKGNKKVL